MNILKVCVVGLVLGVIPLIAGVHVTAGVIIYGVACAIGGAYCFSLGVESVRK